MLTDIWVQILVLFVDIDHTVQDDEPIILREGLLGIDSTLSMALAGSKFVDWLLTAAVLALLVHRHRFEALFNSHMVVEQELL